MDFLNIICHRCGAYLQCLIQSPTYLGCGCGVRHMKDALINLSSYITASGSYPERANSPELTAQVKDNALILLNKVNALLKDLNIKTVKVSSGFRPSSVNAATPGSAKKSLHMQGKAVDLMDDKAQTLGKLILSRPDLLKKHGLWLEDLNATKGVNTPWVHLDCSETRKDREIRVFKP